MSNLHHSLRESVVVIADLRRIVRPELEVRAEVGPRHRVFLGRRVNTASIDLICARIRRVLLAKLEVLLAQVVNHGGDSAVVNLSLAGHAPILKLLLR